MNAERTDAGMLLDVNFVADLAAQLGQVEWKLVLQMVIFI